MAIRTVVNRVRMLQMTLNAFSVMRRVMRIDNWMKIFGFLDEGIAIVTTETSFIWFLEIGTMTSLARYAFCDVHLGSGFCRGWQYETSKGKTDTNESD